MRRLLCKEISIVDDCVAEVLEEFNIQLELVAAIGVDVQFSPINATVKIADDDSPEGNLHTLFVEHILPWYACTLTST